MLKVLSSWCVRRLSPIERHRLIFADEQVLKSIDLAALKFPVIIAENNGGSDALETYLRNLGLNSRAHNLFSFPRLPAHYRYTKVRALDMDLVFVHSG